MKSLFVLIILAYFLQVNSLIWSNPKSGSQHGLKSTKTPILQCCNKDSFDCCCIHNTGKEVHFKRKGTVISIERLSCHNFKNCTATYGFVCNGK